MPAGPGYPKAPGAAGQAADALAQAAFALDSRLPQEAERIAREVLNRSPGNVRALLLLGRAWVMINSEWPKIKGDIDSGFLSPLALVTIKTFDPTQLGENHQVFVWGYDLKGSLLTLYVYDPRADSDHLEA